MLEFSYELLTIISFSILNGLVTKYNIKKNSLLKI